MNKIIHYNNQLWLCQCADKTCARTLKYYYSLRTSALEAYGIKSLFMCRRWCYITTYPQRNIILYNEDWIIFYWYAQAWCIQRIHYYKLYIWIFQQIFYKLFQDRLYFNRSHPNKDPYRAHEKFLIKRRMRQYIIFSTSLNDYK